MNVPVRFFCNAYYEDDFGFTDYDTFEITENQFCVLQANKNAEPKIYYERHTMHENGVNQICLTISSDMTEYNKDDLDTI